MVEETPTFQHLPQPAAPTSNTTGHTLAVPDFGVITEENMKHTVETSGFEGLEESLGMTMPEIYENYALGKFDWQHSREVPQWLQPNLAKIHGGAEQYKPLIEKYQYNTEMMRNLERVDSGVNAPNVLKYLDRAHNEIKSIWHDGSLSTDQIQNITQGVMPNFAYNSQGHVMLVNDNQINHGFNHNRNIVNSISWRTGTTQQAHQMNFQKEAESLSQNNPLNRIRQQDALQTATT